VLHAGDVVDRFEVVELLGVGGLAQVFKVRHRVLGSFHALKVVTAGGPAVARRLLREGSIQAQLRHPNVVAVTDVIEVRGHSALVLEYVEGITLQGLLAEKGALRVDEALALFSQVLAGVAAAHAAGVLHRDLKPGNILLAPGPTGVLAKVTDFGLAKVLVGDVAAGAGDTIQGLVMGTPGYMAPEQAGAASGADARADVFALGVVLYEMLTGVAPFTRDEIAATLAATLLGAHVPIGEREPALPTALADTVERCLEVDRLLRYADARELARALYGDRPDLAEVVEGSRAAAPLAISLPSVMPLRAAGLGSAAVGGLANPTMAPASFGKYLLDDAPASRAGATLAPSVESLDAMGLAGTEGARAPTTVSGTLPPTMPAPPASSRGRIVGIVGLAAVALLGAGLWFGRGAPEPTVDPTTGPVTAPSGTPRAADVAALTPGTPSAPLVPSALPAALPTAVPTPAQASTGASGSLAVGPPLATTTPPAGAGTEVVPNATTPDVVAADPVPAPVVADAADVPDAVDPAVAAAAAAKVEAEARTAAAVGRVSGTWQGTWSGRPFTLALEPRGGDRLGGQLEVLVGTSYRTFSLGGTLNGATGRFTLSEDASPGWWVDGVLDAADLTGSIRHPDQKKATSYTAKRR
jgi:hypothetical protein